MSIKSLHLIAYEATIQQFGTPAPNIQMGKKYKLFEMDGVNTIALGKCVEHRFFIGVYQNNFRQKRILTFELNNNHPLLRNKLYYDNVFAKINIVSDDDDEEDVEDEESKNVYFVGAADST